jgi:hypothetical protein
MKLFSLIALFLNCLSKLHQYIDVCSSLISEMNEIDIMRGTWFFDGSWQPIEEGYASQIETEHLANFENERIPDEPLTQTKGQKKGTDYLK